MEECLQICISNANLQTSPNLLPYIKEGIDAHRSRRRQYLLTGSQNLLLAERVTESPAGRAAMLHLLPLAHREESGQPGTRLPWERAVHLDRR